MKLCLTLLREKEYVSECHKELSRKEGNILFNDKLNTFYFTVIWHPKKEPSRVSYVYKYCMAILVTDMSKELISS